MLHLVTAAKGAESFYTLHQAEGAGVRTETPDEAVALDERTAQSWVGHNKLFVIDNDRDGGFAAKMSRVVNRVFEVIIVEIVGSCRDLMWHVRWWVSLCQGRHCASSDSVMQTDQILWV